MSVKYKNIKEVPNFQFLLKCDSSPKNLRQLTATSVQKLVVIQGIIVSATKPAIKASNLAVQCRHCGDVKYLYVKSGYGGVSIPRICDKAKSQGVDAKEKCPLDSYAPVAEYSQYIDIQSLKLQ